MWPKKIWEIYLDMKYSSDCYLKRFYLQRSRSKNINIKKISIINYGVCLTPDEIFEPFVEISNDLTMNSVAYLKMQKQSSRGVVYKKVFLEISQNSQENTCAEVSFLIKLQVSRLATLLKKRLWHRSFPVNFAKFLRTTFLQNTSGGCF